MLDLVVEGCVSCKTRCMVHLEQVWLAIFVQKNVEAENLEAHRRFVVCRLTCPVVMCKVALYWQNSFDDDLFDFFHQFLRVLILIFQSIKNFLSCSFVASVIV